MRRCTRGNKCLIWEVFARRGLGENAGLWGSENFDLPMFCGTTPSLPDQYWLLPAPIVTSPFMQAMMIPSVTTTWKTVMLDPGFMNPVPVCTIQVINAMQYPAVVRMRNVVSESFEIRLQNAGNQPDSANAHNVHCLVVEEGSWSMPDGSTH